MTKALGELVDRGFEAVGSPIRCYSEGDDLCVRDFFVVVLDGRATLFHTDDLDRPVMTLPDDLSAAAGAVVIAVLRKIVAGAVDQP